MLKKFDTLIPGSTIELDQFNSVLRKAKTSKAEFMREYGEGYFDVQENEVDNLIQIVGDRPAIYNYFNKKYLPYNIKLEVLRKEQAEVKSNNIYDRMAAPQITFYRGSFNIGIEYGKEPITVYREFQKDTTLSMRDIVNFM